MVMNTIVSENSSFEGMFPFSLTVLTNLINDVLEHKSQHLTVNLDALLEFGISFY